MHLISIVSIITGMVYLGLGLHVLSVNIKSKINRFFALICINIFFCSFVSSFMYSADTAGQALFLFRFAGSFFFIFIVLHLHFYILLTKILNPKKYIMPLLYVPTVILVMQSFLGRPIISNIVTLVLYWIVNAKSAITADEENDILGSRINDYY